MSIKKVFQAIKNLINTTNMDNIQNPATDGGQQCKTIETRGFYVIFHENGEVLKRTSIEEFNPVIADILVGIFNQAPDPSLVSKKCLEFQLVEQTEFSEILVNSISIDAEDAVQAENISNMIWAFLNMAYCAKSLGTILSGRWPFVENKLGIESSKEILGQAVNESLDREQVRKFASTFEAIRTSDGALVYKEEIPSEDIAQAAMDSLFENHNASETDGEIRCDLIVNHPEAGRLTRRSLFISEESLGKILSKNNLS